MTIATVAHHARVSRQTVSNVLNAPHLVRPETRERVRAAIDTLGYRVSQAARQMRTGRSRLIAVRIGPAGDGINGSVLDRFLHGLTEAAAPAGYRIVLYTAIGDDAEIAAYEELLGAHDLDGFVLTGTHPGDARTEWLTRRGVPFVTFGRPWAAQPEPVFGGGEHASTQHSTAQPEPVFGGGERASTQHSTAQPEPVSGGGEHARAGSDPDAAFRPGGHPWVDVDGAWGTRAATQRLLTAGHRRIGFIGWPPGSAVGDDRRDGWAAALRAAGGEPSGLERRVPDGVAEGARAAADLLATAGPTALVCASDSLALGALRAAATHEAAAHEAAAHEAAAPEATAHEAATHEAAAPEATAHEAATHEAAAPEATAREATAPGLTTRGATAPEDDPSRAATPEDDSRKAGTRGTAAPWTEPGDAPPHRIAVIGFDDTPVAQAVGLTSVSQPLAEAAAGCVALLTRLLDGRNGDGVPGHVLLRPRVIVRGSG